MEEDARRALHTVRRCLNGRRYVVLPHFMERMDRRGIFWGDVLGVVEEAQDVRSGGVDDWGREKWILAGPSAARSRIELVCVLDRDEKGQWVVWITVYEREP